MRQLTKFRRKHLGQISRCLEDDELPPKFVDGLSRQTTVSYLHIVRHLHRQFRAQEWIHLDALVLFVVTLLACFGPFFCYICRLNLSLTIDQMVVKEDELGPRASGKGFRIDDELASFQTEEHTLAKISGASFMRLYVKRPKPAKSKSSSLTNDQAGARRAAASWTHISALGIEFDTNPGKNDTKGRKLDKPEVQPTSDTADNNEKSRIRPDPHLLNWSTEERNDLLGAFFIGYLFVQVPGARAAEMFGAKSLFIVAGLGSGLCSLVFPFAAKFSSSIIYAYLIRIIMGVAQGAMFPAGYVLLCEWLPKSERGQWLALPSSFSRFGTIVMYTLVPMIMSYYDWEMVFYVSGVAALIWSLAFALFGSNSPNQSYWLSKNELIYIESHMEPRVGTLNQQASFTASGFSINEPKTSQTAGARVSWKKMLTNRALWILSLAMFMSEWSNMLLLIKLPGFLGPALKMELAEIGFWSSVLIAVYCIHCPASGFLASKLELAEIEWLDTLRVRKLFEIIAHTFQAFGCLIIALSTSKVVILGALSLMMLGRATVGGGQCLMPPELSKEYPGTVFAFANTVANTAGFFGPMVLNWLVKNPNDPGSWFNLWLTSAILFFAGGIVFCLFADNRTQNYCRKPKAMGPGKAVSEAQLTLDKNPHQIFSMEAFSPSAAVATDPEPIVNGNSKPANMRRLD